jgi:hypothetical protein
LLQWFELHRQICQVAFDPAILLRVYAKRTQGADESAAAVIGELTKNLG